jgi:hypothetical protein
MTIDLGSHWRIREPFSDHRMLIVLVVVYTMSFLPRGHGWRQQAKPFGYFTCALFDYCDVQFVKWRLVEMFESYVRV